MTVDIIIPAHNEEEIIADTIKNLEDQLTLDYRIIVVNDHSSDTTTDIVEGLRKRYLNLQLVNNDAEQGFANTLRKGFSVANSDLVIPVMADLCDDPRAIIDMYEESLNGFDIVCGSRYMRHGRKVGGPILQSFFSRFVGISLKYLIGIPTSDVSNSFKCYRKSVLKEIKTHNKGFEISMEITLKAYFAGFSIKEVPTTWKGRFIGKSKFYLLKVAPAYIRLYLWAIFRKRA
jgi:dolichol-phosphate mannosyltransferase